MQLLSSCLANNHGITGDIIELKGPNTIIIKYMHFTNDFYCFFRGKMLELLFLTYHVGVAHLLLVVDSGSMPLT